MILCRGFFFLSESWKTLAKKLPESAAEVVAGSGEGVTGTMQRWLFRAASGAFSSFFEVGLASFLIRAPIPFRRDTSSQPNYLPKAQSPKTITLRDKISMYNSGVDTYISSLALSFNNYINILPI